MKEKTVEIRKVLNQKLAKVDDLKDLNDLRVNYLGKRGQITLLKNDLSKMPDSLKKEVGKLFNDFRNETALLIENKEVELEAKALETKLLNEKLDFSLPATKIRTGSKHPLQIIVDEIEEFFISMGYDLVRGPEIESDVYNFSRLNVPQNHPARDMQDSLYITENYLLRTQTSPVQARTMEANKEKNPLRIICSGKVYRKDDDDATHSHQFMQIEGLMVGENISVANLKATLELFAQKLFGKERKIRFRPSYFPFTEPSFEVDVSCFKCNEAGCHICKKSGWLEILGCGMVHPEVLKQSGYDSKKYTGFAFGMGPERIAMLKYGITDIRHLYQNNLEFLETFSRIEKEDTNETK